MRTAAFLPTLVALGITVLVSACSTEATATEQETSETDVEVDVDVAATPLQDSGPQPHDLYAAPLPPSSEDPPIYNYETVPSPASSFDHEPLHQAFSDALGAGMQPNKSGLIEFSQPVMELEVNGETFTVDGVINPAHATPLYEDQLTQDGVGPLAEELTAISWHSRREAVLQDNVTAAACGPDTRQLWVAFDVEEPATCFENPGGVTDPYFRGISAYCTREKELSFRTVYMGFGGEHSFDVPWGHGSGWDMMYRGPTLQGDHTCYAFTVPVRGATTGR